MKRQKWVEQRRVRPQEKGEVCWKARVRISGGWGDERLKIEGGMLTQFTSSMQPAGLFQVGWGDTFFPPQSASRQRLSLLKLFSLTPKISCSSFLWDHQIVLMKFQLWVNRLGMVHFVVYTRALHAFKRTISVPLRWGAKWTEVSWQWWRSNELDTDWLTGFLLSVRAAHTLIEVLSFH